MQLNQSEVRIGLTNLYDNKIAQLDPIFGCCFQRRSSLKGSHGPSIFTSLGHKEGRGRGAERGRRGDIYLQQQPPKAMLMGKCIHIHIPNGCRECKTSPSKKCLIGHNEHSHLGMAETGLLRNSLLPSYGISMAQTVLLGNTKSFAWLSHTDSHLNLDRKRANIIITIIISSYYYFYS